MKTFLVTVGIFLGCMLVVLGLGWLAEGNDFFMYKLFAPKRAAVERQVFEHTRSFNQGMIQELESMQFSYVKEKEPEAKAALADIILHRAAGFNIDDEIVPASLRSFVLKLRADRTGSERSF
jgi:hypothetical protein